MVMPSGVTLQLNGDTLECVTDSAEAADAVWVERRRWLTFWPAARLQLRWCCPESRIQVSLCYEPQQLATGPVPLLRKAAITSPGRGLP